MNLSRHIHIPVCVGPLTLSIMRPSRLWRTLLLLTIHPNVSVVDAAPQAPWEPPPLGSLQAPIQPIRCASNTVGTGARCARCAFLPFTLCPVHYRYWVSHHRAPPPGGAQIPGSPHPLDAWRPTDTTGRFCVILEQAAVFMRRCD